MILNRSNKNKKLKMKSKRKRSCLNIISTLPQSILEIILCLLPTREAARTSILSREWRYKWTKIPKLDFGHYEWHRPGTRKNMEVACTLFYDIGHILLLHQGPIHELTLHICNDCDCFELDQIILYLSKNHTVKKLALEGLMEDHGMYNLPIYVFSLHHLTGLHLKHVDLDHQPIFNGFGSLTSLVLYHVGISTETLLHLLSNCPSLKSFSLLIEKFCFGDKSCTLDEIFECLPAIEHLKTWGPLFMYKWLVLDSVPQELPTSLFQLKYFCFEEMYFDDDYRSGFLLGLIKSSPNLEKIKLEINWEYACCEEYNIVWEKYSDVWLEHLNELEIDFFRNTKPEMEFVKFILARSPKLKKVSMRSVVDRTQELEMLKTLLEAPRVSPVIISVK